jgi:hypothetical protein
MRRRAFVATCGASLMAGMAGCSGASGSAPSAPDSDTDPTDLLPPTPEDMTEIRRTSLPPGESGAEAGALAEFQAEPGERYYTEVLRWPSADDAEEGQSLYEDSERAWSVYVTNGPFSWAGASVDGTEATLIDILGTAEGLTSDYVQRADVFEDDSGY